MLEKWLLEKVSLAASEAVDKVRQFGLETIAGAPDDESKEIREGLAQSGVWALQNPLPVFKAYQRGEPFVAVVGMRPASTFHLGHLTLMRELSWLVKHGGQPIFFFASCEAGKFLTANDAQKEMWRFGETYTKYAGTPLPKTAMSFSDRECRELQILEDRVAERLSVRKTLQLYGWDGGTSVGALRVPAITAATFLFSTVYFPDRPSLVLSDIHQITHAEATKIVAHHLKLPPPSYTYRVLLSSLQGPTKRMSVKDPKSRIFLSETREQVTIKLQRSFSGGRGTPEEQRKNGGRPHRCSFFKVAEVLQSFDKTTQMYSECVSGTSLCSDCKKKHIPVLVERILRMGG